MVQKDVTIKLTNCQVNMDTETKDIPPLEKPVTVKLTGPELETFKEFKGPDDASFDKFITALDRAYHRTGLMMWRSFLTGLMQGIGTIIGFLITIIALVFIFRAFNGPVWIDSSIQYLQKKFIPTQLLEEINNSQTTGQP